MYIEFVVVWWHQAITWTNVDFSLVRFCGIYLKAISQQVSNIQFCVLNLKIILLKLLPHSAQTSGYNEIILSRCGYLMTYSLSHEICIQFCHAWFCCHYVISSWRIVVVYLPISFRVTSLALGQSYDCPSISEVTLKNMGKIQHNKTWAICVFLGMYCVFLAAFFPEGIVMGGLSIKFSWGFNLGVRIQISVHGETNIRLFLWNLTL